MSTITISGRKRIIDNIVKTKNKGHKKNCAHKMSDNEAVNVRTNYHVEFRRCIKNCGFWINKVIYFDTDKEFIDMFR